MPSGRGLCFMRREMGWWGGEGGESSEGACLPSIIGRSTGWELGFRATVAAVVTTAFGDDLLLSLLGLRTREGLSPFFTRSGERRKADILVSVKSLSFFPRNVALATTLCTWHLTLNVAGASSWGKRQGSTAATKAAALVTPRWWTSAIASATEAIPNL